MKAHLPGEWSMRQCGDSVFSFRKLPKAITNLKILIIQQVIFIPVFSSGKKPVQYDVK
jgi:hypothetical protein